MLRRTERGGAPASHVASRAPLLHRAEIHIEIDAGLLSAGMEPEREAFAIFAPQLRFAKRLFNRFASGQIDQPKVPEDIALRHSFAEVQVKLQVIRRHGISTGKHLQQLGCLRLNGKGMHGRRLSSIGPDKHRLIRLSGEKRELRREGQSGMGFLNLPEQGVALKRAHDQSAVV